MIIATLPIHGDPTKEAEAFLHVDAPAWSSSALNEQSFKRSEFPKGLWKQIEGYFTPHGINREDYAGYSLDLNGDGKMEYFIETPFGGSGGPHFSVVAQVNGQWIEIASFQGGFHLLKAKDGWMPIVGFARGGADSYFKFRLEFRNGTYQVVWAANFTKGNIQEKKIEQADAPNSHACGTFVTDPAEAGSAPKAGGSR